MSTAAGGSGDDGSGDRPSPGTRKTKVGPPDKMKKMSTRKRAIRRYLQGKHVDVVAAGEEPPFGGRYAPPPAPSVADPPAPGSNPQRGSMKAKPASSSRRKDGYSFFISYDVVVSHMSHYKFL